MKNFDPRVWMVAAIILAVWLSLIPNLAHADCQGDPTKYACGEFCQPIGRICCDTVGHPELSCPAGTYCKADTADIKCADVCTGTQQPCGNSCYEPSQASCCASVGHPEFTCPTGHQCIAAAPYCESITSGLLGDSDDHSSGGSGCTASTDPPAGAALLFVAFSALLFIAFRVRGRPKS